MRIDHIFAQFAAELGDEVPLPRNFDCLRTLMGVYEEEFERFSDYGLKYVKHFV